MKVLQQFRLRQFEDSLAAQLTKRFPESSLTADRNLLYATIREGLRVAKTFGIVDRVDLRRFLEFSAEYGPDLGAQDFAPKLLSPKILPAIFP